MSKFGLYLLSLVTAVFFISPEDNILNNITDKLERYVEQFPQEKVYLHTDRSHYTQGETIWLKSYVTAGYYHQPSPISNNIHVELYAPDKKLVSSAILRSEVGFSAGHITLPEDLESGSYLLRGYTNWMRNFGDDYFFEKAITVVRFDEPGVKTSLTTTNTSSDITFFPEGGQMVAGVPGRIAFKAIKSSGLSTEVSGIIYDAQGNEKVKFKSEHDGMGVFTMTPEISTDYYAIIDGSSERIELPGVVKQGFSVSANSNLKDMLRLTFRANDATTDKEKMYVVIQSRGLISYAFELDLSKNISISNVPKKLIPAGIAQVTLFNANGAPVLERLVFVKRDAYSLNIKTDKATYQPREKVVTTIELTDTEGNPAQGNFSLAAIDINQSIDESPDQTIQSNLLLTSDLKGFIENPTYYFEDNQPERLKHLDLVMMTHGWRRFTWDDILEEKYPEVTHLIEKGIIIKGKLLNKLNGKPVARGSVTYLDKSAELPIIQKEETDNQGNWQVNNVMLYDNNPIILQGENKRGKKLVEFQIDSLIDLPEVKDWVNTSAELEENKELESFLKKSKSRQLINDAYDFDSTATIVDGAVVTGNRFEESQKKSVYGSGESTLAFDKLGEGARLGRNAIDVLQGRIAGVQVSRSAVTIRGVGSINGSTSALLFLNDMPVDIDLLLTIPAIDIERVEVFKGPRAAIFGVRGAGGALAFYTNENAGKGSLLSANGVYTTKLSNAYQGKREFYAPKYEVHKPEHIKPDRRVLIHWEPLITTDDQGKAIIEFWNTDLPTTVQFDIQGLSLNGLPLVGKAVYEVKN